MHAISVGEVISSVGLIARLRERSPGTPVYVSVGTVAGREVARDRLANLVDGVFYAPIDYAFAVRRVLRRVRPSVVVIFETEIWPVLYREAKRAGCALVVVNGRISDRAFPRYRRWRFFFRPTLQLADAIFAQSEQDRERYVELGVKPALVRALGNLKYDAAPLSGEPPALIRDAIAQLRPSVVWIAASTMAGVDASDVDEDDAVIASFRELTQTYPRLLLILVPRKPERFGDVAERLHGAGIPSLRRSRNWLNPELRLPCAILLDSIGELASLFPLADVVFMGGTLARRGGHNLLEPASSARAIIAGSHLENFAAIAEEFREHRAMLEISSAAELTGAVRNLIDDAPLRRTLGARAAEVAAKHRGATDRIVGEILDRHDAVVPGRKPRGVARPLLWTLAELWRLGSAVKRRRDLFRARRLETPVISLGGISMGGSGKTPLAEYLAEQIQQRGKRPAILTRGYRRRSIEPSIAIEAGARAPVALTGDEAQIYIRAGHADTGIGADRWSTGRILERLYQPDVFVLDDGFQHWKLKRDLDLVLIDALDPVAGAAVFPLGGLREPLKALGRADAFILMRAAGDRKYRGLKEQLRAINPRAPIFRAKVEPRYWVNLRTGRIFHPPEGPAAAFCGLGNPASFWATLKEMRIHPVFSWPFGDHHRYRHAQIRRLAAQARAHGAQVLLCTEKDALNLPEGSAERMLEERVELYWLKIGIQVDEAASLFELIEARLNGSKSR